MLPDFDQVKNYLINNKLISIEGCWLLSNRDNISYQYYAGYGVHRLSMWIFNNFDITNNMISILHKCDNPPCWNPEHLFLGTQSDNRKDSILKGRSVKYFGKTIEEMNQTHCKNGHEFSIINTYYYPKTGKRECIECRRERDRRRVRK